MVKLKGPGLSAAASGSLGNVLTFSSSKGRAYVKHHPTPAQPRSGNQVSMRTMMQFLSQQWANLTTVNQATWLNAYPDPSLSLYNSFIKYNLEHWRSLKAPSQWYPPPRHGTVGANINLNATGNTRHVKIQAQSEPIIFELWGFLLFHSTSSTPAADFDKLIHIIYITNTSWHTWTHTPLDPGTHYYRITGFSTSGKLDLAKTATDSAVVT